MNCSEITENIVDFCAPIFHETWRQFRRFVGSHDAPVRPWGGTSQEIRARDRKMVEFILEGQSAEEMHRSHLAQIHQIGLRYNKPWAELRDDQRQIYVLLRDVVLAAARGVGWQPPSTKG